MKATNTLLTSGIMLLVGLAILPTPLRNFAIKGVGVLFLFSIIVGLIILFVGAISPKYKGHLK